MKKLFLSIVLLFGVLGVASANITSDDLGDFNTLSDTQKADIVSQIAKAKETNRTNVTVPTTPAKMKEWVDVGTAIGKGMAATAKELGVALDDFAKSSVGKIALALLIWKVAGSDIVGLGFGMSWLFIMGIVWVYFFKRIVMKRQEELTENEKGKTVKVVKYNTKEASEGAVIVMVIALIAIVVVGLVSIFG